MGDEPRRRTLRFAVYPHAGDWTEAGTHRLAAEYATPVLAVIEPPHAGRLGRRFSFASSSAPNVEIEWLKRAEDEPGFVLRLVEWSGIGGVIEVATACPRAAASLTNLLEDPGDPLPADGGGFRLEVQPHEIASVRLECDP
jgi:alpha-mannosidase